MSASGLNLVSGKAARIGGKRRGSWVDDGEEDDENAQEFRRSDEAVLEGKLVKRDPAGLASIERARMD
jgi:hypothetical protein